MNNTKFRIENIPAVLYSEPSDKLFLFVHGKCGYKEEAERFASLCVPLGWQVLSCDLPGHGERKNETDNFYPWIAVPELQSVRAWADARYKTVSLRANSIGAWFSMLAFSANPPSRSLFVSPLLDMEHLIRGMMSAMQIREEELREKQLIPTPFGETLSWKYLLYALDNPINSWQSPTQILYGTLDNLTGRDVLDAFTARTSAEVTIMEGAEHWFHTPQQLAVLDEWTEKALRT